MAASASPRSPGHAANLSLFSGPRPARYPRDVPQITRLVELCFADVLDYTSRRMLQDVRDIAEMGGLAWRLARLVGGVRPEEWLLGSVWEENGRIAGNATLTCRAPEPGAWLLSNVAVHPDFRRRGIAHSLVRHALAAVRGRGGRNLYLQVDAANETATRLYRELGFVEIGRRTAWTRAREERKPPAPDSSVRVSVRKPSDWKDEFALWKEVSPAGTAWNTPLVKGAFRPSLARAFEYFLTGERELHVLARRDGRVVAALSAYSHLSGWEGALVQRRGTGGAVERELLDAAWRVFPPDRSILLETTPEAPDDSLIQLGFQKRRIFIWMRYTFNGGGS
jgi:ribosomal protein S18 acetylase RimI-like enzyme